MVDKHIQSQGMLSVENKAVQAMVERIRGNRPEISDAVRQEIYEVNAAAAELHILASFGEPDSNSPIIAGYRTTWGEKKEL
jgi:4-hydroxy-3-methylbut-2-en-1-yl diphosphate synthase IspG/GcpE